MVYPGDVKLAAGLNLRGKMVLCSQPQATLGLDQEMI